MSKTRTAQDPRKPNLFVVGAAKSGTTSLHHFLARHTDIYMSELKEPGFFAEGIDAYPKDPNWYLDLFTGGEDHAYRGESSTHYTKLPTHPGVVDGIAQFCDKPKFIYLMRDPIDRAISHYWHNTRQDAEFRPPLRAMKENIEFRAFGDYARQLKPYFREFGRGSVFTATFERLIAEPRKVTSEIFRWLDLDPSDGAAKLPAKNTKPGRIERFLMGQRIGEFLHHSDLWDSLSPLLPQQIKDAGKRLVRQTVRPDEHPMDEVVEYLRPWAQDSMSKTARLLDREFPEWSTTQGDR